MHWEFLIQFPNGASTDKKVAQDGRHWNKVLCPLGVKGLAVRLLSPLMELRTMFRNADT